MIPDTDRVYIQWQTCKIKPFTIITRCYKCHRYGHSAKSCAQEKPTCGHCTKEGHLLKECPEKEWDYKCANCIRDKCRNYKHDVASSKCPQYSYEMQRAQKQISCDQQKRNENTRSYKDLTYYGWGRSTYKTQTQLHLRQDKLCWKEHLISLLFRNPTQ